MENSKFNYGLSFEILEILLKDIFRNDDQKSYWMDHKNNLHGYLKFPN